MKKYSIFTLVFLGLVACAVSQTPTACTFTNGKDKYDLSALTAPKDYLIPKNKYPNQSWDIYINVCKPVTSGGCTGAGACQNWGSGFASLGAASTQSFGALSAGKGLIAQFTGGSVNNGKNRNFEIQFICDMKAGKSSQPVYAGEDVPSVHYKFTWNTPYACPAGSSKPSSHKISGGTVIIILLLCGSFLYVVVGLGVQKFVRHKEGRDIIPNYDFWVGFPGLVKDGVMLIVNKITGKAPSGSTYSKMPS